MYRSMYVALVAALMLLSATQSYALEWDGSEECEQEAFDYYVKLMVCCMTCHNLIVVFS